MNFFYFKSYFYLMLLSFGLGGLSWVFYFYDFILFLEWNIGGSLFSVSFTFFMDTSSLLFCSVVSFITSNVVFFSQSYMHSDDYKYRFLFLVLGFYFSMFVFVFSCNIFSILLGWDGLGLFSYCLVIYYSTKKSSSAGMITVLSNRIGDVCILVSIAWISMMGELNFFYLSESDYLMSYVEGHHSYLLMVGALTKSAQIPFSAWLPAAMAAPTPVSALVHSSTLVTAGVYLLYRVYFLLNSNVLLFLMILSILTMFMAGLTACFEFDLKKIIALSTLSQLSVMMLSISIGSVDFAFFHLVVHAVSKSLLFLSAGYVIHMHNGSQDIRDMGGLCLTNPFISLVILVTNMSLCGFPFMAGYYSKDLIVENFLMSSWGCFLVLLLFVTLGFTVFYSVRLIFFVLFSPFSGISTLFIKSDLVMIIPMMILMILCLILGPIFLTPIHVPFAPFLSFEFQMTIYMFLIVGFLTGVVVPGFRINYNKIYYLLGSMFGLSFLTGGVLSNFCLNFVKKFNYMEAGWLEFLSLGVLTKESNFGLKMEKITNSSFKIFLISAVFLCLLFFLWY